tara:strand:+ start:75 stop:293 length:219 start_codon:yes stop_codon:yes gene_type:complete
MKIAEIYKKMIEEKLSYRAMAAQIEPNITHVGLFYHVKKYCELFGLPLPKLKGGRKAVERTFKLITSKEELN